MNRIPSIFLLIFLLLFPSMISIAQEPERAFLADELIELEGDEGKILVFPSPVPGPNGSILRFVMFGVCEAPDVVIDTISESISPEVTTIYFKEGCRFSGWIEIPNEEIRSIWINGWFIPWLDIQ